MAVKELDLGYSSSWRNHSRDDLRKDIFYTLGAPTIKVNLTDEQVDSCISYALKMHWRHHPDFSFENYYVKVLNSDEATQRWFLLPERIDSVVEILPQGFALSNLPFGTWQYQLNQQIFSSFTSLANIQLVDYVLYQQKISSINMVLGNQHCFKFARLQHRVELFFDVTPGDAVAIKVIENVDPDDPFQKSQYDSSLLWDSESLKNLSVAKAKQMWGNILRRFQGALLPGNITINGESLIAEGEEDENELLQGLYSMQLLDIRFG